VSACAEECGTAALIVAAGYGRRLGYSVPKAFLQLGGSALFLWSARTFEQVPEVTQIVLVVPAGYCESAQSLAQHAGLVKLTQVIPGGKTRCESVFAGLEALSSDPPDLVAIHDGVRPFVCTEVISRTIVAAEQTGAAIAARPVTDTLKKVDDKLGVTATVDRTRLWHAQTPQTFRFARIYDAYQQARAGGWQATDDASLVEQAGEKVMVVEDDVRNFKITVRDEWQRAQALVAGSQQLRIGHGFDVHPFAAERPLMLGGVRIPFDQGLAGHSDADVLLHAIADALLGAAGLGDIGRHFPDTDRAYKDADSTELLARTVELLSAEGYQPLNVDATIIAQRPRLAGYIPKMQGCIAAILGLSESQINVKATTTEQLGFVGREEGIAAQAVALIVKT